MSDSVRCPSCRGAKKVAKLGGVIGECNTCSGKGTIAVIDKPKAALIVENEDVGSMVAQVAECTSVNEQAETFKKAEVEMLKQIANTAMPAAKIDGKKAVFKHKKG